MRQRAKQLKIKNMPDKSTVKSNRERYAERMKSKYPDREFADDEALWGQVNEDYDGYDKEIAGYKEREKAFSDLFTSDPRSAAFLTQWRKGKNPAVALVEMFGDDFVEELKDPAKQEELAAASKEYADRLAKEKEFDEQYQKNITKTLETLEQMQQKDGYSDDDIDKAMSFLVGIMKDGIVGKFTPESIEMALRAINHDDDVATAAREGEVRGRNTRIEEKLRRGQRGDGTANLDGKNGGQGGARQMPDLGVLNRYDDGGQTIWERGGEKRRPAK
jgi:hypothetical protein